MASFLRSVDSWYLDGTVESGVDPDEVVAWRDTCSAADWFWPPVDDRGRANNEQEIDATAYVHEVDFHWFHGADSRKPAIGEVESLDGQSPPVGYQQQADIFREVEAFKALVLDPATLNGYSLRWMVAVIGFPAEAPSARQLYVLPIGGYFADTTPEYQAGMLVRLLLTFWAAGAATMNWHAFLPGPTYPSRSWDLFSALGLREGVFETEPFDFSRERWRRPSWYSFRRLVALTNRASSIRTLVASDDLVLLRLAFRGSIRDPEGLGRDFNRAYVMWRDYKVNPVGTALVELPVDGPDSWAVLPMVPEVTLPLAPPDVPAAVAADGSTLGTSFGLRLGCCYFPNGENVVWGTVPHQEGLKYNHITGKLEVTVYPSTPSTNPGPLVLLVHTDTAW